MESSSDPSHVARFAASLDVGPFLPATNFVSVILCPIQVIVFVVTPPSSTWPIDIVFHENKNIYFHPDRFFLGFVFASRLNVSHHRTNVNSKQL